jgi:predicted DNA-binding transcriptional regulator AlpA
MTQSVTGCISIENLPDTLNVKDVQMFLRISRALAYQLVNRSDFPKIRIGNIIRVPKNELLKWIEAQTKI